MELRDLVGWLLAGVALFSAVAGVWAAWHFAPHRVYARQLRLERRARREANASRSSHSESIARLPSQPVVGHAAPTIHPLDGIPPTAGAGFHPDPTLMGYVGVFTAPAERDQCSLVEAAQFDTQTDSQPIVSRATIQAISVDAVGSDPYQFAPSARGRVLSPSQSL
jgi:hypothetical protein